MSTPPPGSTDLLIPTSRDVRVRLFPLAAARPHYYASDAVTVGLSCDDIVRQEASTEDPIFPNNPEWASSEEGTERSETPKTNHILGRFTERPPQDF
jgi:hypothetical protein